MLQYHVFELCLLLRCQSLKFVILLLPFIEFTAVLICFLELYLKLALGLKYVFMPDNFSSHQAKECL